MSLEKKSKKPMRLEVIDNDRCVGCQSCMFACNRRFGEAGIEKSAIYVNSLGGFEHGFVVKVCRACKDPPCARVCPTEALTVREGGGVRVNPAKCIGCKNCVRACILGAVGWDESTNKPNICIYCGICANYCPYDVIKLTEIGGNE
jgi:Fe-S-cluster-containing dehydrogenase component